MSDSNLVDEIFARWHAAADGGAAAPPEQVIAAHPEHADDLRMRFATLRQLGEAFPAAPLAPERIGEYRILREIGRGGMGVVYEAEQEVMRRRVALKVLFPSVTSTKKAVKRFQQEAQAAGRLKHTNIVAVYQLGHELGTWYCAMELVEGRPFSEVIADLRATRKPPRESRLARRALELPTKRDSWTLPTVFSASVSSLTPSRSRQLARQRTVGARRTFTRPRSTVRAILGPPVSVGLRLPRTIQGVYKETAPLAATNKRGFGREEKNTT